VLFFVFFVFFVLCITLSLVRQALALLVNSDWCSDFVRPRSRHMSW
jgi:hypothetical protein